MRSSSCSAIVQDLFAFWTGVAVSLMIVAGDNQFALGQAASALADRDVVQFAGGAIEIQVPAGWQTHEIPVGRELRIWLTERDIAEGQRPHDGVWMTFHWRGRDVDLVQLEKWLDFRIGHLNPKRGRVGQLEHRQLGQFPALVREVDHASRRTWILLAATNTGIFELTATAEFKDFQRQRTAAEAVLGSIKLSTPQIRPANVRPAVQAAAPVVGLWKSLQAKLWLGGDGRIAMEFDRSKNFRLDESGNVDYERQITRLTGQYEAREDILFINWDDGSRVNFRWQVDDGQLLLTDHNGRVSQLDRLVE